MIDEITSILKLTFEYLLLDIVALDKLEVDVLRHKLWLWREKTNPSTG